MKPLVSVIVPTRNRAGLLSRALNSIFAQRRLADLFELEVVVVDDASTDNTPDLVRSYHQVRYVRLAGRGGIARARNEGVRTSTGGYLAFLDDDDVWLPHKLELQVPALDRHPEVGVVYGQFRGRFPGTEGVYPCADNAPSGWIFREMLMENCCGANSSLLIRRAVFDRVGYFDESLTTNEDYDVWLRLAFQFSFLFLAGVVSEYAPSAQGLWFSSASNGSEARDRTRVVEKGLAMLPDSNEFACTKREARARAALNAASPLLLMGDLARAWSILRAALRAYPWVLRYAWGRRYLFWATSEQIRDWRSLLHRLGRSSP